MPDSTNNPDYQDSAQKNTGETASGKPKSKIASARVEWQGDTLVSQEFGDLYFSKDGGLAETSYVFLTHNQLEQRWQRLLKEDHPSQFFTLAETGFGTGLNFLAAVQLWQKVGIKQSRLHYISFEKYPLTTEMLEAALEQQRLPQNLIRELVQHYPPHTPGFHRLELFDSQVLLTLCFGDANKLLPQLSADVDAWFLDGFSPAKNPELWKPSLFTAMAKLSSPTATFATFTAASLVRKGLANAGFIIHKSPGYGKKREMIYGEMGEPKTGPAPESPITSYPPPNHKEKPWFHVSPSIKQRADKLSQDCLVVGGGLAGTASAYALAKRGWKVTLLEREPKLACGASGNPTGVLFTKLSPHDTPQNRFNQFSFLYATEHMRRLLGKGGPDNLNWNKSGVLQLAYDEKELARHKEILACGLWPQEIAFPVDATKATEISGVPQSTGGLFFPEAGWVNPPTLCETRANHKNIDVIYATEALSLSLQAEGENQELWNVSTDDKTYQASHLIIANARDALSFEQTKDLPLRNLRGQVSFVKATEASNSLDCVLCYDGYTSPARKGYHCVGATFHPKDEGIDLRNSDHTLNLNQLREAAPDFYSALPKVSHDELSGRAQVRCQTPDYLPIVGPVADQTYYKEAYAPLRKGMLRRPFPPARYLNNLYVNLGHGSRGLTTSALSAEIIAAYMTGETQPIDQETLFALHPGRFLIRDLKRRTI